MRKGLASIDYKSIIRTSPENYVAFTKPSKN